MNSRTISTLMTIGCYVVLSASCIHAQFDVSAYKKFLEENKSLNYPQILDKYNSGRFVKHTNTDYNASQFFDETRTKYSLTQEELSLIQKHSFMVTDRVRYSSFRAGFNDVYTKDLPVYISSDAILHAWHRSYDNILAHVEYEDLYAKLNSALTLMRSELVLRKTQSATDSLTQRALRDADLYLTVSLNLMDENDLKSISPLYSENANTVLSLLSFIDQEQLHSFNLFSSVARDIDFSQYTPRGHYADLPRLKAYFKTMIWLGRTELYIVAPTSDIIIPKADIRRQCALSMMMVQLAKNSSALDSLDVLDKVISAFVGTQDNLSSMQLLDVVDSLAIDIPALANDTTLEQFQNACVASGADQKILSQVLISNGADSIKPAAAYMLMGQRFIIDSYAFANLVFDKVPERMMPATLDAMFALGNNSALQLLEPEIERYKYAPNIAGLRYLFDSFSKQDWSSSIYATWLEALRTLNPPSEKERGSLPQFMQTAAWWQKNLTTQLASWAELRHDNLLYAKQSYTGGAGCFYPKGYVEPVPRLYATVKTLAASLKRSLSLYSPQSLANAELSNTLNDYDTVCANLESIAIKELNSKELSQAEKSLIENWIRLETEVGCDPTQIYSGWYQRLQYQLSPDIREDIQKPNFVVADVHTQPTDLAGNIVGNVLHVGTGAPTLAVIVAKDADGCMTTYSGPVSSYYEFVSTNFKRLTDEEWRGMYRSIGMRPALCKLYMADSSGSSYETAPSLLTSVPPVTDFERGQVINYPNPFSTSTLIAFSTKNAASIQHVSIAIFSMNGEHVADIYTADLGDGNYVVRWDGSNARGVSMSNGTYVYRLSIGPQVYEGKVMLSRD